MNSTITDANFRERGRSVLDFAASADREAWQRDWARPTWALGEPESCWTQFTLTSVADFEAELGFLVHGLGLDVFMVQQPSEDASGTHRMAMLAPHVEDGAPPFIVGIREADPEHPAAAPGSVSHEFMTRDLPAAWQRLLDSGVEVVREPWNDGWMDRATVRTPSGHEVQVWSQGTRP